MRMTSPQQLIPVAGPWITEKEIAYVTDAVTHAWYRQANMYHERFEAAFAHYVGRRYAITLPSCTAGLHLALLALNIQPGDEVIVPDITWIASAAPISYVGATPVFADVDPHSWCLSAESFQARITPKTKAVIVVDLYGNMPDLNRILEIAQHHDIAVIEDAAEAIGSEYRGQKAGSFGEVSVFSFHGSKTLTTGEGGMLVTDNQSLYERCLVLRDHGRDPQDSRMFWNAEVGYKYKMSSMQAALGLAQLERIEELVDRKREIFAWYAETLGSFKGITFNTEAPAVRNTYWMVSIVLDPAFGLGKEELIQRLKTAGIDSRPFFYPLSTLPAYQHLPPVNNPVSMAISPYAVNLPSGYHLTREAVSYITQTLQQVLQDANA